MEWSSRFWEQVLIQSDTLDVLLTHLDSIIVTSREIVATVGLACDSMLDALDSQQTAASIDAGLKFLSGIAWPLVATALVVVLLRSGILKTIKKAIEDRPTKLSAGGASLEIGMLGRPPLAPDAQVPEPSLAGIEQWYDPPFVLTSAPPSSDLGDAWRWFQPYHVSSVGSGLTSLLYGLAIESAKTREEFDDVVASMKMLDPRSTLIPRLETVAEKAVGEVEVPAKAWSELMQIRQDFWTRALQIQKTFEYRVQGAGGPEDWNAYDIKNPQESP